MPEKRIYSGATPDEVAADLKELVEFRDEGMPLSELARLIERNLVPHLMRYDSAGFQSMFNSAPEDGAALGAEIALAYNQGVTNWQVSPGGATLEELCCRALCGLFGFPPGADATFMYCGTYANQQALYLALHGAAERRGFDLAETGLAGFGDPARVKILVSADAHFSIRHAVRILGLGEKSLVRIPVDKRRRADAAALPGLLSGLAERGEIAACVVATAGTTGTGAVDPIERFLDPCAEHGAWLHVDGAYGLAYSLVPEWRPLFSGFERADSVSWDPHKQLGAPIPSSVLFLQRGEDFRRMALHSDYFNRPDSQEPNPGLKSAPSTRPLSALALVASLKHQGLRELVARLKAPLASIRTVAELMEGETDIELCHRPDTGVLCFRVLPRELEPSRADDLQRFVHSRILAEGQRSISIAEIDGKTVLRLVAIYPRVTSTALMETIEVVRRLAREFIARKL